MAYSASSVLEMEQFQYGTILKLYAIAVEGRNELSICLREQSLLFRMVIS